MRIDDIASIEDAPLSSGSRVVLRLDLNVPCLEGRVTEDFRIRRVLPTLDYLSRRGCRTVIISHLDSEAGKTLLPVCEYLKRHIQISFALSLSRAEGMAGDLHNGGFLLVENIRHEDGEEKNDEALARRIAGLGDVFVNDAFSVSHRVHASVVGVPKFLPAFAGFLLIDEVQRLSVAFDPPRPSLFILGGAKFGTKLPLLLKFIDRYERVFVGGALANDAFRAMGMSLGSSLVGPETLSLKGIIRSPNVRLPIDFIVKQDEQTFTTEPISLSASDRVVDAGPKTIDLLEAFVSESKFVLWNGPLGEYQKGFAGGTEHLARVISESGVQSVIGGGDTVAVVERMGILEKFGFVSTGGGAMLEFLTRGTLPGIEALTSRPS